VINYSGCVSEEDRMLTRAREMTKSPPAGYSCNIHIRMAKFLGVGREGRERRENELV
jgi:hypothetical protein